MLFVDAHVHIYNCYDLDRLFQSAYANFQSNAFKLAKSKDFTGVLMLTESKNQNYFSLFAKSENSLNLKKWKVESTGDQRILKATDTNGRSLYLCKGCQHICHKGLEILELLKSGDSSYNLPARELIKKIQEEGGVAVLPWAFGKWIGKRGKVIGELLQDKNLPNFHFGDNGGRPKVITSYFLTKYKKERALLLSGSDPLPIKGEEERVGSFGVYTEAEIDTNNVGVELSELFHKQPDKFKEFGQPVSLIKFIKNQLLLRITK